MRWRFDLAYHPYRACDLSHSSLQCPGSHSRTCGSVRRWNLALLDDIKRITDQGLDTALPNPLFILSSIISARLSLCYGSRENIHYRHPLSVFCHIEGTTFNKKFSFRTDSHRRHDRCVQIHDGNGILRCNQWAFVGGFAI